MSDLLCPGKALDRREWEAGKAEAEFDTFHFIFLRIGERQWETQI